MVRENRDITVIGNATEQDAERRTLRVALAYWQARLTQYPDLLATEDGHAEWERTARLMEQHS